MLKQKNLIWTVVAIALALISVFSVISMTRNYSINSLYNFIMGADKKWLLLAVVCMMGYIVFEGLALMSILKGFGHPRPFRKGVVYGAADIYFSAITPSATGGQPASAFFMNADGIPTAVSVVALVLNIVMYTASILFIGIVAVLLRPGLFAHFKTFSMALIIFGYVLLIGLAVWFILLLKKEQMVRGIFGSVLKFLNRIHIVRDMQKKEERLDKMISDYKKYVGMIDGHFGMLVKCFLYNLAQRVSQILVPAMVYMSVRSSLDGAIDVWVTQVFVTIGSSCMPVPGAMGVSDYLLLDGLRDMMSITEATSMELASRGISFYSCVLISILIVAAGYVSVIRKSKRLDSKEQ